MTPTETAYFIADGDVTAGLDETIAFHSDGTEVELHLLAAPGSTRSARHRNWAARSSPAARWPPSTSCPRSCEANPLKFDAPQYFTAPDIFPNGLGNKLIFGAMTELWYRTGKTYRGKAQNLTQFYHPLDMVGEWNRAYGAVGFAQYQFVVPTEAVEAFKRHHVDIQRSRALLVPQRVQAVRAGQPSAAELSDPRLERVRRLPDQARAQRVPQRTRPAGARIRRPALHRQGLRTTAEMFHAMYPRIDEWIAVRRKVDPDGVFASDMARRLELL